MVFFPAAALLETRQDVALRKITTAKNMWCPQLKLKWII